MHKVRFGRQIANCLVVWGAAVGAWAQTAGAEPAKWVLTRELACKDATQAAAADEKFVYALSNPKVVKLDRNTGERVAESTGPAEHLNSGFFWHGKLYCAHSNYPKMPEESQIKVLDPQTMRLTTFKDFGQFDGGSLTWAFYHDNHWWCNFAKYGRDNDKSVVVKFDDRWREVRRWTYPDELVRQLDGYSLSGGVWHEGGLLVADHDHRVLYRLRVPEAGSVLEYVGKSAAPFTGQGIAHDPKTGGLVGIDRPKRVILFAVEEEAGNE